MHATKNSTATCRSCLRSPQSPELHRRWTSGRDVLTCSSWKGRKEREMPGWDIQVGVQIPGNSISLPIPPPGWTLWPPLRSSFPSSAPLLSPHQNYLVNSEWALCPLNRVNKLSSDKTPLILLVPFSSSGWKPVNPIISERWQQLVKSSRYLLAAG